MMMVVLRALLLVTSALLRMAPLRLLMVYIVYHCVTMVTITRGCLSEEWSCMLS